ncbi:MAG: CheR family methyltransferase, partial [Thermodesulfobacteriota bacterium]
AGMHMPIDSFFISLAEEMKDRAIGIILSGTASDGALGTRRIKAEGGITFAQDMESARYSGMPASAVATGAVDFVMKPDKIVNELMRISKHPYVAKRPPAQESSREMAVDGSPAERIFALLRESTDVDFSQYKFATIRRRILRRMALHKIEKVPQYVRYLKERPGERLALFDDLLIDVTSFFRDPELFEVLKNKVYPQIMEKRTGSEPIRIWVPGCSTGEEVYSIAISLLEAIGKAAAVTPIQIFGTDLNQRSIEQCRAGYYPETIAGEVSAERLRRFFVKANGGYQIGKHIREMCVFSRQNLSKDPPFSRLDLLSCRNVLIYMKPTLQRKVLPIFHYSLKPNGFLVLGTSETVGEFTDLFAPVDHRHKIYTRKTTILRPVLDFGTIPGDTGALNAGPAGIEASSPPSVERLQREADALVATQYAPPGVLVNENLEILQFRGDTGPYLAPSPGTASLKLFRLLKEGLGPEVRVAIQKARKHLAPTRKEQVTLDTGGRKIKINLEVLPFRTGGSAEPYFLVLFENPVERRILKEKAPGIPARDGAGREKGPKAKETYVRQLEQDLQSTVEYTQAVIEEHEATNEELRSANEEIQSANEELQSTNEELETAKEELQSANEELTTVNEELANRNEELAQINNDLVNLLENVNVPVVMVGHDLRIRRFTVHAETMLKLIPGDVGRPIGDIRLNVDVPDLEAKLLDVMHSLQTVDIEVVGKDKRWYTLRMRPYKTIDHKIEGAVITLLDIEAVKRAQARVEEHTRVLRAVIDMAREPMIVLRDDLTVELANHAFYEEFGVDPDGAEGARVHEVDGHFTSAEWMDRLHDALRTGETLDFSPYEYTTRDGVRKKGRLNALQIEGSPRGLILIAIRVGPDALPPGGGS